VPVAIAAKPLPRSKQLTKSDIFFEERDISKQFKGYYTKIEDVTGLLARTQIRTNTVLNPGQVHPPRLIKRGQSVDLFIKTASYEIHGEGKALSDGARGDLIRVKNSRSNKIVEGTVVGPGSVRIGRHD
jgi:flagella basal body P-ring formation protein FlgA